MSLHRRAARRDDNEPEIRDALERIGAQVRPLSGEGVPDLLVGFKGATYLLGVKRPDGPKGGTSRGRGRQSGDQRPDDWPGGRWVIVTSPEEAVVAVTGKTLAQWTGKMCPF